ncbi:MFS transporter [Streptomyces sp. ISL-11]|uniref:MFS transporter n=1 Tax=Streptomyces sp. ISL-11 TaxID=2819174 RepID=UPI001BEA521D|nr:MFS transporter [Streptomyces sp. ISL-11]MBT2384393.1 MFS transporter [Streptomyces sp. ISL-11]
MADARLRHGRLALSVGFGVQGAVFALLVTRIPAIQDRYGISDGLLPAFLAAVPVLAGAGSLGTERLVAKVRPGLVLRWTQPLVCLALLAAGSGHALWQAAASLAVFGVTVGALDASMNMLGVSLQRAYARSIMLGFHASYSLGGIIGASLAWAGAHWELSLPALYGPLVALVAPAALIASRWYADRPRPAGAPTPPGGAPAGNAAGPGLTFLLPLCLVMTFAYIGDSTVANWSAKYLQDVLHSSDQLSTVPYNAYMVMTLLGRTVGDLGVRRLGPVLVVRAGTVVAACGFAVVAVAPGAWVGTAGFTLLGLGLSVIVPQTFAAAGRRAFERYGAGASDMAVARLNVFNYVGFLVGSPLVGALGEAWSPRGAMAVPMILVLATLWYAPSFGPGGASYGGGHERPRTADVG